MDKVEKIRNEIEKLHGNPYYMMAIKDVLSIIDSLQEENSFDSHIQEGDKITVNENGSRFNRSQLERVIAKQKQPVSEELNIAEMADDYYDALMEEASVWMDEGTMCHCRLAYYTGCKDVLNKIRKGE